MHWIHLIGLLGCVSRHPNSAPSSTADDVAFDPIVAHADLTGAQSISCDDAVCRVQSTDGPLEFDATSGTLRATEAEPLVPSDPWARSTATPALEESWNAQVKNQWRSPFRVQIPSAGGGRLRIQRGLTPGTSRVVRLGGSVLTARQSPDPGHVAYPNALALHPTGAESYLIVWPNSHLIAFDARTLQTTWRIRLGDSSQGLFVSEDGRYLVAESGAMAPEHQMLDYEPAVRVVPEGIDPAADEAFQWLERPTASHTVLVDLGSGRVAARLPGAFVGFALRSDGAVLASRDGIVRVRHMPTTPGP